MVVMLHIEEINQSSNFSFWRDVVLRDCYERGADLPTLHEGCHRIMKRRTARHLEFS